MVYLEIYYIYLYIVFDSVGFLSAQILQLHCTLECDYPKSSKCIHDDLFIGWIDNRGVIPTCPTCGLQKRTGKKK